MLGEPHVPLQHVIPVHQGQAGHFDPPANPILLGGAAVALSKVQSVDQRMRLECGLGFRQLRMCRRIRRGSYVQERTDSKSRNAAAV